MRTVKIPSGVGIIVTYKCSAACAHCCYSSSPSRSGAYMSRENADRIFSALRDTGCLSVHIGGGEPFLNFDKLLEVCLSAKEYGVEISYIETNASWAVESADIKSKLRELTRAGVSCLLISLDPFHNAYVPYDSVKRLSRECDSIEMESFIWQNRFERFVGAFDSKTTHTREEYNAKFGDGLYEKVGESYGLNYNGRAIGLLAGEIKRPAEEYLSRNDCAGAVTSLHHAHIDCNFDVIPNRCNGFKVNLFDLIAGIDRSGEKYRRYSAVANGGISALFDIAKSDGFREDTDGYVSGCALCFELKKYLYGKTHSSDLGPEEFFSES